jgi:ABC-2 type transport system ATP-binding protein
MNSSPLADERDSQPAAADGVPAIRLANVTKTFGPVRAVRGIDLTIEQGEIVAFLGPNGAGKTTSIDMMLGLSQPTSGSVDVLGLRPRQAIARGLVSAVMQTGGLLKDLTVRETVAYMASLFADTQPIDEVLEHAGITGIAGRKVAKCSGGEQQRLRFAMALLSDPALLLLDEPTTGMDVEGRRAFWSAIRRDAERGRTVLFATHYLEEADQYADRIVLMRKGRIVADGTGSEIKALAAGRTVRATLQHPDHAALSRLAGVDSVEVRGDTVLVHARDTDAVARHLLNETDARDLEITTRGIEEAFLTLTGGEDADDQDIEDQTTSTFEGARR